MGRHRYKHYLKNSLLEIQKNIPRQTRFNMKKRQIQVETAIGPPECHLSESSINPDFPDVSDCEAENNDYGSTTSSEPSDDENYSTEDDFLDESTEHDRVGSELPEEDGSNIHPNLTVKEGSLLIFAFILKHRISNEGVQHLLDLIRLFCPGSNFPGSKYLLKKQLNLNYKALKYHYYCPSCNQMIQSENKSCPKCSAVNSKNYFITFDVKNSFESVLQQEEVSSNLLKNLHLRNISTNEDNSSYQEIYHGDKYRKLQLKNFDFTATMNNDGVPCFRSSNFSISPFLLSINELSYNLRKKHTFVAALWFGKTKPIMHLFLPPIIEMLNSFSAEGFVWESKGMAIDSQVFFPILAADSVARCTLQGINQFNGCFGCPWCLEKGETYWENDTSHKWVYKSHSAELRDATQFFNDLKTFRDQLKVAPSTKNYHGIQNASPLLLLNQFDIVSGFVLDYMHTMELGVSRTLTNAWLDSKHRDKPFYIGNKIQILNDRIKSWRMPSTSDRTIRILDERKHWKSSEWRIWTFLAPIILKDVLPSAYYGHFLKYVRSLFLLCGKNVYKIDIPGIRDALKDFVESVENLYGASFCSFNMHLLVHATKCVQDWGPLWNYSLFHFENFNGILLKYFKASCKIETQISNKIIENSHVFTMGSNMFSNDTALYFYEELIEKRTLLDKSYVDTNGCVLLGASKPYFLNEEELDLILKTVGEVEKVISCDSFKRGYFNSIHVGIQSQITKKRCTCVVKYGSNIFVVKSILLVTFSAGSRICYLICSKLKTTQLLPNYPVTFNAAIDNKIRLCKASSVEDCSYYSSVTSANVIQKIVLLPNSIESE